MDTCNIVIGISIYLIPASLQYLTTKHKYNQQRSKIMAETEDWIQRLYTSRDNNNPGANYIGQEGRLFYRPDDNTIRVSDGVTPGGIIVSGGGGGIGKTQIDGGAADSVYLDADQVNGGSAASVYTPSQVINGGFA
jgi:hypothetical protein